MENRTNTRVLVEAALMVALAMVLSKIEIPLWLQGGSITLASMLPIIFVAMRNGVKWGLIAGLTHGLIQMMLGFHNVLYCTTLAAQVGCILLDYIIAYTALGLAPVFGKVSEKPMVKIAFATASVCFVRFVCSFLSGILIWGGYAPEGSVVWIYSLAYNGGYMLPETIITTAVAVMMKKQMLPQATATRV